MGNFYKMSVYLMLLSFSHTVLAETTSNSSSSADLNAMKQQYQSILDQQSQQMKQMQQQAQNQDRADKSDSAKTAAMIGAAMAGLSCMMLMKKAMEEEDPSTRDLYMMMAMQQCQQAAQDKDSGDKNKNAAQTLTANDSPKLPDAPTNNTNDTPTLQVPDSTVPTSTRTPSNFDIPATDTAQPTVVQQQAPGLDPGTEQPVMGPSNLNVDENAGRGNGGPGSGPAPMIGTTFAMSSPQRAIASEEAQKKNAMENATSLAQARNSRVITSAEGAGSDGGGSSGKEGGSGIDSMLSQLMGGQAPGAESLGAGSDIVAMDTKGLSAKATPNIFEYASFRYKNLTYQEGRVEPKARRPKI